MSRLFPRDVRLRNLGQTGRNAFCARDQFGIKPFYYAESGNDFYYASESKAIYKVLEDKKFDKDALQDYMTFQFVPEPETLTKEIKMLEPGHYIVKKLGQNPVIKRYYYAQFSPVVRPEEEYVKKFAKSCLIPLKSICAQTFRSDHFFQAESIRQSSLRLPRISILILKRFQSDLNVKAIVSLTLP